MEKQHSYDLYGRKLAYVLLSDGTCLNEVMINEGYARPYSKNYCKALASYQVINFERKQEKRSLYSAFERFEQTVYPK
jgi:micrococcal nuclease